MLPVLPLIGNCNTGEDNEDLLNAGCRRWLGYIMSALAKRAIRMSRAVSVDVSKLCRGADEEKDCEEGNEQNAGLRTLRPYFADPSHNYCSLYIILPELPINDRPPGGFRGPLGHGKSCTSERTFLRLRMLPISLKVASCSVNCGDGQRSASEHDPALMQSCAANCLYSDPQ